MLTDRYNERWLERLNAPTEGAQADRGFYLLVNGVFVPGLHRLMKAALPPSGAPTLLFEALPGCNDKTGDVSPFLIRYHPSNAELNALLGECTGFPMIACSIRLLPSAREIRFAPAGLDGCSTDMVPGPIVKMVDTSRDKLESGRFA
jgi:hypothetical protein